MILSYPTDFRRYVRPFFLTPDGERPTPYKIYYDVVCYLTTQVAFCFTTAPFVLLSLPSSLLVWSRVYFYAVLGTAASMALFASPAKPYLIRKLHARNQPALQRVAGATAAGIEQEKKDTRRFEDYRDGEEHPLMGLPSDLGRDVDEAVQEIRDEVEARRGKGRAGRMPTGVEMKTAVEEKLGKKL